MNGYSLLLLLVAALSLLWPGQGRGGRVDSARLAAVWRRRG